MALYREDATGFVQEHATNPGAGYTAISAMPTTNIDAKAEWWRDLDKWNQTSDWHPSLASDAEDPNNNFLSIAFTNESAMVSADADGNVTDGYLGATTQVRIMRGSRNVTLTEGWTLGLEKSPNDAAFTYNWTGTDVKTLQITGFPTDETSGYIRITATRTGSITLVKDFKILKVIRGANGTNGTDGVRGSRQILVSGTSWSDAAAWNGIVAQTGTVPVLSDLVTIADAGTGFSVSKFYAGGTYDGTWLQPNAYINGNLLVTGTVGANSLVAGSITTSYLSFTPVQAGGAATDVNNYATTISGSKITTNSLNADRIAAGTLSASQIATGELNASLVNVTNINASNITTGSINGSKVDANTLNANRILASSLSKSSFFTDYSDHTLSSGGSWVDLYATNVSTSNPTGTQVAWSCGISVETPLACTGIRLLFYTDAGSTAYYIFNRNGQTVEARHVSGIVGAVSTVATGNTFYMKVQVRHTSGNLLYGGVALQFMETKY